MSSSSTWIAFEEKKKNKLELLILGSAHLQQVYEPYQSIVGQERGRTHKDLYERRKIN